VDADDLAIESATTVDQLQLLTAPSVYDSYASLWFARFSLLQEAFMFGFLYKALEDKDEPSYFKLAAPALFVWIVAIKYVKVAAHFRRHPEDIPNLVLLPWSSQLLPDVEVFLSSRRQMRDVRLTSTFFQC
jgi:hypothetical protein